MGFKAQTCWTELLVFWVFETGPEFLISVQTGYFSGFPEPCWIYSMLMKSDAEILSGCIVMIFMKSDA